MPTPAACVLRAFVLQALLITAPTWALLQPDAATAEPRRFVLAPGPAQIAFRAYGFGMLPIDGNFTRFDGTLTLDKADPAACAIAVRADAASLRMGQQVMTDDALGPDLLDVKQFPEFRFEGRCEGDSLNGTLLLHGVSKTVAMQVGIANGQWQASGTMTRAEWGMGARPMLAGPTVRITITAGLPR